MAESVALRIEDSLDELELLEKSELCTRTEIRVFKIKREQLEFKMARHKKSKDDILKYIDYLMHTIMLMRARKMQKQQSLKKCPIEFLIAKRVKMLFDDAIQRYPADLKIWISYIKICKQIKFFSTGSQVVQKMLTVHGDKPSVFKMAADWERLKRKDFDKARAHLQSGLHIHSDSQMLYLELFRLELAYIDQKVNKQRGKTAPDPDDPIYQLLDVVYDSAMTKINSLQFMVELLQCTVPYEFTVNIQNKIVSDMQTKFPNEEATWDTVAKMALRPYPKEKSTAKERHSNCMSVYRTAVKTVNTEEMWTMYLNTMIDLLGESTDLFPNCKRKLNHRQPNIDVTKIYEQWLKQLSKDIPDPGKRKRNNEKKHKEQRKRKRMDSVTMQVDVGSNQTQAPPVCQDDSSPHTSVDSSSHTSADSPTQEDGKNSLRTLLQEATESVSSSVALWEMRLRIHLMWGEEETAEAIFDQAILALRGAALPMWAIMLLYWNAKNRNSKIAHLLKRGSMMTSRPLICVGLRMIWLDRIAMRQGIGAARKFFEKMQHRPPVFEAFHHKMLQLESQEPQLNVKFCRFWHINACLNCGGENFDVWKSYLLFEKQYGTPIRLAKAYQMCIRYLKSASLRECITIVYNHLTSQH